MESYTLSELGQCIRQNLKETMPGFYWIVAEINEMHVNSSGHCYLELIEKTSHNEQITAKARAAIWAYHFRMLRPYFESTTGQCLTIGLKVMLQVSVEYHELYGLSLQITDINPSFTIGDITLRKQAVIRKLTEEGVINMNRELELTPVPQRIAVISSETAAGYGDFKDQLHNNPNGYVFYHTLFHAVMQGNEAESSIISALERIFEREDEFDAVVITRGGGSQSDLNCFNSYRLTACMAQFPLPVITGIGHDRDETIADLVACRHLKTPTAVAEFLINTVTLFDEQLQELIERLADAVISSLQNPKEQIRLQLQRLQAMQQSLMHTEEKNLQAYRLKLVQVASALLAQKRFEQSRLFTALSVGYRQNLYIGNTNIAELTRQFHSMVYFMLKIHRKQIDWLSDKQKLLDPANLLHRGYSITTSGGKAVRSASALTEGQQIETIFSDGKVESIVNKRRFLHIPCINDV